jgi:hypothetical protein
MLQTRPKSPNDYWKDPILSQNNILHQRRENLTKRVWPHPLIFQKLVVIPFPALRVTSILNQFLHTASSKDIKSFHQVDATEGHLSPSTSTTLQALNPVFIENLTSFTPKPHSSFGWHTLLYFTQPPTKITLHSNNQFSHFHPSLKEKISKILELN